MAVAAGRQAGGIFEGAAERGRVVIADATADLVDRVGFHLEKAHSVLDACVLKVGTRGSACGGREPARQSPLAQAEPRRELGYSQRIVKVEVDVLLDLVHDH